MLCVGCLKPFTQKHPAFHVCAFKQSGFKLNQRFFQPCQSSYHQKCIRVGHPFQTRFENKRGLFMPSSIPIPNFTCELCTVRANVWDDLQPPYLTYSLMMLERMRMIDMAHAWAQNTVNQYRATLKWVNAFAHYYKVPILQVDPLKNPPVSKGILLAWAELAYSLRTTETKSGQILPVKYGTITQVRSAVGMFFATDMLQRFPQQLLRDKYRRFIITPHASPSEEAITHFFHLGLSRRIGTAVTPSWALSWIHIAFIDSYLEAIFSTTTNKELQHNIVCAGVINLFTYLGWLRSQDIFNLQVSDITVTTPINGPARGLPPNVGAIELRLLKATKANQTETADVVIAFETLSGLTPGKWFARLLTFQPVIQEVLFSTHSYPRWTSRIFREHFAHPILEKQRSLKEPTLAAFSDTLGERIQDRISSMHSWRRTGRSRVSCPPRHNEPNPPGTRTASEDEVYFHGRWLIQRKREKIDRQYNQWDLVERIPITLCCS